MRNTASFSTFKGVAHLLTTSKNSGLRHVCLLYRLWLPHSIFCEYFGTQVILCLTILKAFNVKLQQVFSVGSRSNLVCVVFFFFLGTLTQIPTKYINVPVLTLVEMSYIIIKKRFLFPFPCEDGLLCPVWIGEMWSCHSATCMSPVVFSQCWFPWLQDEPEEAQCDFDTVPRPPDLPLNKGRYTVTHTHSYS